MSRPTRRRSPRRLSDPVVRLAFGGVALFTLTGLGVASLHYGLTAVSAAGLVAAVGAAAARLIRISGVNSPDSRKDDRSADSALADRNAGPARTGRRAPSSAAGTDSSDRSRDSRSQ